MTIPCTVEYFDADQRRRTRVIEIQNAALPHQSETVIRGVLANLINRTARKRMEQCARIINYQWKGD